MGLIAGAALTVIGGVSVRLLADELKAWMPHLTNRLIRHAVGKLPADQRERLFEEWSSDVDERPGDLSKLWTAADCIRGSWVMTRERARRKARDGASRVELWLGRILGLLEERGFILIRWRVLRNLRKQVARELDRASCDRLVEAVRVRVEVPIREGVRMTVRSGKARMSAKLIERGIAQVLKDLAQGATPPPPSDDPP
ncbi:MAG: hypothetical protein P4L90_04805 [Rhodopila sp.]|nr:hypothetical protein [Rhodopila sp.]